MFNAVGRKAVGRFGLGMWQGGRGEHRASTQRLRESQSDTKKERVRERDRERDREREKESEREDRERGKKGAPVCDNCDCYTCRAEGGRSNIAHSVRVNQIHDHGGPMPPLHIHPQRSFMHNRPRRSRRGCRSSVSVGSDTDGGYVTSASEIHVFQVDACLQCGVAGVRCGRVSG